MSRDENWNRCNIYKCLRNSKSMTTNEAFSLFCDYGNVSEDIDRLKQESPTTQQLDSAEFMMHRHEIPRELITEARRLIEEYFAIQEMNHHG